MKQTVEWSLTDQGAEVAIHPAVWRQLLFRQRSRLPANQVCAKVAGAVWGGYRRSVGHPGSDSALRTSSTSLTAGSPTTGRSAKFQWPACGGCICRCTRIRRFRRVCLCRPAVSGCTPQRLLTTGPSLLSTTPAGSKGAPFGGGTEGAPTSATRVSGPRLYLRRPIELQNKPRLALGGYQSPGEAEVYVN